MLSDGKNPFPFDLNTHMAAQGEENANCENESKGFKFKNKT